LCRISPTPDASFEQAAPRDLEIAYNEMSVAKRAGRRVGESLADLEGTARSERSELHDPERVAWRVIDVNREADLVRVESNRPVDVAHRDGNHFD
jgi:hypothetical protein